MIHESALHSLVVVAAVAVWINECQREMKLVVVAARLEWMGKFSVLHLVGM